MLVVGIKILKNKLSEYVRVAAGGETVLVTERGRVVAELSPPRQDRSPAVSDAVLAEAVRKGWITPPFYSKRPLPDSQPVATLAQLLSELDADRRDG